MRARLERLAGLDGLADRTVIVPLVVLLAIRAIDEMDTAVFGTLAPEIRDDFGLSNTGIAFVQVAMIPLIILLSLPIGYLADRRPRSRLAIAGAILLAAASLATPLSPVVWVLVVCRAFAGVGRAVNLPVHESLVADYVPPENRAGAYTMQSMGAVLGRFLGPVIGGAVAYLFGWRAAFVALVIPAGLVIFFAVRRLWDPVRGNQERRAEGADEAIIATEESAPQWDEAWRTLAGVRTLRRIWHAYPFLIGAYTAIVVLMPLYLDDVFGVNELGRGAIGAGIEPFGLAGLLVGIPLATRLLRTNPARAFSLVAAVGTIVAAGFVAIAVAPALPIAVGVLAVISFVGAALEPMLVAVASLVIPPRARSFSIGITGLWVLPGLVFVLVAASIADAHGLRVGMLAMAPVFLVGAYLTATAGVFIRSDMMAVRMASVAHASHRRSRDAGEAKLLVCRGVEVAYDGVKVLFGVDFDVEDGEIVALLGTNGAGKSTLLKAVCGLVAPVGGAIVFDGRDETYATAQISARRGLVYMPGGKAVFPSLTVAQNLHAAGWLTRRRPRDLHHDIGRVLDTFPRLRDRLDQPAGNLSGGEQQMLGLGMALLAKPKLLLIDELTLGLAPVIVTQLLDMVREINAGGTTVVVVEQSVNVALALADRAVFLEKGEVRFEGPTAELIERPDVLRSVFLEGASRQIAARPGLRPPMESPTAASQPPLLEVRGLAVAFGGIVAVDGVDLTVERDQTVGLIGPNGAGKTTLFDLICGYLSADAGTVLVAGRDVSAAGPDRRARAGLGRSFQDARLFPALTVRQAIAVAHDRHLRLREPMAAVLGLPDQRVEEALLRARVDELVELLSLEAYAEKYVAELSTGSRRIVDIACALAHDPTVLLLDEPSSGIAQRETEALLPLLEGIRAATGTSLLVIEHDMPLITALADELVALDLGRVIARGRPKDVIKEQSVIESYLGNDGAIERSGTVEAR